MDAFIYETSNNRAQRLIMLSLLILLIVAGAVMLVRNYRVAENLPINDHWYSKYVPDLVHDITPLKLLYLSILGGMIFFPIPVELAFFFSITQGHSAPLCIAAAVTGFMVGNVVNYLVGLKMSRHVSYILSAKKFYALRRQVNRWGTYAIIIMNVLPAPSDVLTVGLGTIRYNRQRLFVLTLISTIIKFTVLALCARTLQPYL